MINKYDQETLDFILQHKPTDFFNFTQRTEVCLINHGIESIREMCLTPEHTFLKKRNVGTHILLEIKGALSKHGLRFGMLPCELKIEAKEESNVKLEPFIKQTMVVIDDVNEVSLAKCFKGDVFPIGRVEKEDVKSDAGFQLYLQQEFEDNDGNVPDGDFYLELEVGYIRFEILSGEKLVCLRFQEGYGDGIKWSNCPSYDKLIANGWYHYK